MFPLRCDHSFPCHPKNAMRLAGVAEVAVGVTTIFQTARWQRDVFGNAFRHYFQLDDHAQAVAHIASLDFCLGSFALAFTLLLPDSEKL